MHLVPVLIRLTLCFSCCFFAVTVHAQIPTNGLAAHWPFTGNANDASSNGNHGNPNNVTLTTGKQNLPNTAYLFNSSTSFIGVPYDASLNVGSEITMCAVFKPTAFYQGNCQGNYLFARGQQGTTGSYEMHFVDNPYNSCAQLDTNLMVMGTNMGNNLPPTQSVWQSPAKIHTGTWYCVVATMASGTLRIYVNGALAHTSNGWNIGSSTDSICIGKYPWGGPSFPYNFTGVIDDMAIYNRALSAAEVDSYCTNAPKIGGPIDTEAIVSISQPLTKVTFCPSDNFILHYTVTAPFNPGNMFTAQLSDAAGGGFANPVNIGSVAATGAGIINCTIPANTPPGTGYRVRVAASDPFNNSIDNGVNLTVFEFPQIIMDNRNIVTCVDDTLSLSVQVSPPGTAITWSGPMGFTYTGNNATIPKITLDHTGNYTITANNNGCVTSDSINITIGDPYFILGNDTTLCESKTLELQALSLPGSAYLWQDGSTGPTFTVREKGLYHVRATNACGSFGSNIQVDYIPCECNPVMPTAFTPNNDGLNDAIGPILDCFPAVYKFMVANRWGNIVFETDDYQKKWDGRHVSVPAQLGTYFYYIQITDKLGNKIMRKGDITLIR